jgi:hypothetical protein
LGPGAIAIGEVLSVLGESAELAEAAAMAEAA